MSKHRTCVTMRGRLLAGVLCLALVLGLLPAGLVQPAEAANWADPYGQQLVEWGVMRGDIYGNLNLSNPITRAEFVTMCNRAFGYSQLGNMPFTDVAPSDWFAEDINIAYNAGYFNGTSTYKASPNAKLTREQAAVLLARNMMLQETSGESLGFSDSRTLQEWSRGLIAAAVAEGMLTGYADGTFRPANNITRGEVAAMLVRVIGTPVNEPGDKTLGDIYGNVVISSSNVTLRNTTIAGNLYITGGVDLGNVLLENVTVLGRIVVSGGGESNASQDSIVLRNVEAEEMVVDSLVDQFVTIRIQGVTDIPLTSVRTSAYLDDSSWPGYGLTRIEQDGAPLLQLAGTIKEVVDLTPASDLQLVQGSAEVITIDEYAPNSQVTLASGTRVDELNLDTATLVTGDEFGKGDIKGLNIGVSGSEVDILPDTVVIRPGTTATIEGVKMDSTAAAELSSEPRLLAGYPTAVNIAPTEAEAQFSGNKPGTVYWAISSVADGSVSEEDLISNPVYGGNIYEEQAGSRSVAAKTVYSEKVEKLLPDGSYYISAILEDGQGKRSPLKVYAFSTPDNTVPAFITAEMTKVTTTVAQVTATANKNCVLYWAVLPAGAAAPTAQEFKTGSLGGNYGYGSLNVVKNVPTSITVNRTRLQEKTTYELYLWLTDANGAQSMATPLRITFTTPDETPPVVTAPVQTGWYATSADATYSMNEPGTLYWSIVMEGNESFIAPGETPEETAAVLADLRSKIKVESGTGAITHGSSTASTAYADVLFTISGLDPALYGNNFTLYYVGKDVAGNYSEMVGSVTIQTLDTTPPTVKVEFTSYNGDKIDQPLADTGIRLVFSEQVKGGANASQTFLQLYETVATADAAYKNDSGNQAKREALEKARETLAAELSAHIKLYQVPRTGNTVLLNPTNGFDANDPEAVLDFRNAQVSLENDGSLVVYLPGEADVGKADAAIRLDSGATYYFQLLSVFDNALNPNGVSNTGTANPQGNLRLDNFSTLYAQVNLEWNTDITEISGGSSDGVRLDVVVDVKPTSTSKVPDTECWDMIIWSDTWIDVKVYYMYVDAEGNESDWEPINTSAVPVAASTANPGISLGTTLRTGGTTARYPSIATSLVEGYTYRYGFHVTTVRGIGETSETGDADSWSDLVTMRFGLIAGSSGGVQVVSGNVANGFNSNYEINRTDLVSYISSANSSTGTTNLLTVPKQFIDTRPPEFSGDFPRFTPGSSTIQMAIQLTRPGSVYYVAIPAEDITVGYMNGTTAVTINSSNDGSTSNDGDAPLGSDLTYIPINGGNRDLHKGNIYYMTGIDGVKTYTTPSYGYITQARTYYGDYPNAYVPSGPATYTSATTYVDMTGLRADTWYYIFVVLEGGGTTDQVVQIYRQKTDKVNTPSINVQGNTNTGYVTPSEDADITYVLVEINALPDFFGSYEDTKSVIYEMINTKSGSYQSLFDAEPDDYEYSYTNEKGTTEKATAAVMKQRVNDYISGASRAQTGVQPVLEGTLESVMKETQETLELKKFMTAANSEYVLLVMGKHPSAEGDDPAADYGYGAIKGLFTQDEEPPTVTNIVGRTGKYLSVSITGIYDRSGNLVNDQTWRDNPRDYSYTGSVAITFDKEIYALINSVRYGIYYSDPPAGNNKVLSTLLGGTAASKITQSTSTAQISFEMTLFFDKIAANETISLFGSARICNSSSYATNPIILTFDPSLTTWDLGTAVTEQFTMAEGGFRVTGI